MCRSHRVVSGATQINVIKKCDTYIMKLTKKLIAIPVVAAVALVAAAAFAFPASAATPERYITINAEGVVKVTPDAVLLNANVTLIAATSAEALSKTSAAAAKVREINGGAQSIPVLIFSDGTHMTEPSDNDLKAKLTSLGII